MTVSKTLEKYIIKIPSIYLPYSKEFETLLTSSKMACSDMKTCTAKQCFSNYLELLMDDLQMYLHNHSLADSGDSGPNSSIVARLDDNN